MILAQSSLHPLPWLVLESITVVVAMIGGIFVFVGLWMEGSPDEETFSSIDAFRRHKSKAKQGWKLLMLGIFIEILVAGVFAAKEGLEINEIRNNATKMDARTKARTITLEQRKAFTALCENVPKMPVKIFVGVWDTETETFAEQMRQMLDEAGFGGTNAGIIRDPTIFRYTPIGLTNITADVCTIKNDTNFIIKAEVGQPVTVPSNVYVTNKNGERLVSISSLTQIGVVDYIGSGLTTIGFQRTWPVGDATNYLKQGEGAIYIPQKNR